jgi:gas vesicle protein
MSQTVQAIGYKADVPSRAKDAVTGKVEAVKDKVSEATSRAREAVAGTAQRASDATPSGGDVKRTARRAAGLAQENPLGLAIGAAALGFLAGLAVPSTRVEDERLGPVADQVKEQVRQTGQEALERGKQVAQTAVQTAKEEGQQHGEELADSAKQRAQEVKEQATSS